MFLLQQISPGVVETEFFERKSGQEFANKLFKSFKVLGVKLIKCHD